MNEYIFRFCLRCVRVCPIEKGECHYCNGNFIVSSLKDDLHMINKKEKVEEAY